jgi:hypothetical protein
MQGKLDEGTYSINLGFFSDFIKKKIKALEYKVHYTIFIASKEIQELRYKKA